MADPTYDAANDRIVIPSDPGANGTFRFRMRAHIPLGVNLPTTSDWPTRSTAPGVVWAHNFENAAEYTLFDPNTGSNTTMSRNAEGFDGGGLINADIPAGTIGRSGWIRPMSALTGATNGRGVNDLASNGETRRAWPGFGTSFRKGYYGHSSYPALYPVVNGDPAPWDGTDFYFQFRCKIPLSRWTPGNPDGKLVFVDVTEVGSMQELIIQSLNHGTAGDVNPVPTNFYSMYTSRGSFANSGLSNPQGYPYGSAFQPGYNEANCHTNFIDGGHLASYTNGCWYWPADEWVTVLLHMIPGQQMSDLSGGNMSSLPANTGIEVWVARQSETAYTKIWQKFDYRWLFGDNNRVNDFTIHPPAFNMFCLSPYMNGVPSVAAWYHRYTQLIFSKQFIACPQPVGTYSTNFPLTENPISEGSKWVTGGPAPAAGLDWTNPLTANGRCTGPGPTPTRYSDPIAHLKTSFISFTANQFAQGTVYKAAGYTGNGGLHEIELHLRQQITAHNARGYEIGFGLSPTGPYMFVVKWQGAAGNYVSLYSPTIGTVVGGINDGDVFRAELTGTTLKIFRTPFGGAIGQIGPNIDITSFGIAGNDPSPWMSGQPGMGFWPVDGAIPTSFGWKNFSCGNLP